MKSYAMALLCAATIVTFATHNINSIDKTFKSGITFGLNKGTQFVVLPVLQHKALPSQPFAQSAIATSAFYITGDEMTLVTSNTSEQQRTATSTLDLETDLANNGGYFVGNYASRKLVYSAAENGYNKDFLSTKGNNFSDCLPEKLYGYTIRENARPIVQGSIGIATHPITQEFMYHTVGLYLAKQCVKYVSNTPDKNN
jgi:hypothetical protein